MPLRAGVMLKLAARISCLGATRSGGLRTTDDGAIPVRGGDSRPGRTRCLRGRIRCASAFQTRCVGANDSATFTVVPPPTH
jgi:hypothetical protein